MRSYRSVFCRCKISSLASIIVRTILRLNFSKTGGAWTTNSVLPVCLSLVLSVDHLKLAVSLYILHIPLTVYVVLPSVATISTNKIFFVDSTELYRWP